MKILFLTHNLRHDNGTGVFSARLIQGIRQSLGCKVRALTSIGAGVSYEHAILHPNKFLLFAKFFQIRRIMKECDIIHALDAYPYGVIAVFFSLGLRKKIIITAIGTGAINYLYRPIFASLLVAAYRRAKMVTAISSFTRREIFKQVPDVKITVINHGVDYDSFADAREQKPSPEFRKYKPYILSVGSLRWRKGYRFSIRAFALAKKVFPDLQYVIVGKRYTDKYCEELQDLIRELGLQQSISILENVDSERALHELYGNAELFILLSQNKGHDVEGFGLVFLEAAASGLAVIGARDCGVEDAMRHGENGYLVGSRNIDEAAGALLKILKDSQLKKSMSEESLVFARSMDWKYKMRQYINLYRGL